MDFAVENDVGLTPDNPHIIYAESSKGNKHIIKFVIFLQYTIDFAQRAWETFSYWSESVMLGKRNLK